MGNLIGFGYSTIPDPRTGLSPKDIYLVTSNWAILKKDLRGTGVKLMLAYLKEFPEYQNYFPFKDIPYEKLATTPKFRAHCSNLIYAFSAILDSLDDVESLIYLLEKTGENHKKNSAPAKGFDNMKVTFIRFLRLELSSRFTAECEKAWQKTFDLAFDIITDKLDK